MNRYTGASRRLLRTISLVAGSTILALPWAGFGWRIIAYPENHIGFDPNPALIPLFAVLMASLGLLTREVRDRFAAVLLVLAVISIVSLLLLRQFNVLLQ